MTDLLTDVLFMELDQSRWYKHALLHEAQPVRADPIRDVFQNGQGRRQTCQRSHGNQWPGPN